jgi:hypothetical protein
MMKKRYILNGFPTQEDAQKRNHEFALSHGIKPDSTTMYMFSVHCLQREEWGLEVLEDNLDLLDESEKTPERLREIPNRPFVHSYVPMVFRYLESKWVDEFFKSGSIRLSSFKKFHQHEDEQRGDKKEGSNMIFGIGSEKQFGAMTSNGHDAFVLATSLTYNEKMYQDFDVDSCFVIEKPHEFMDSIIKAIPEFKGLNFGPCLYQPYKIIQRQMPGFDLDSIKSDDDPNTNDMGKMFNQIDQAGGLDVLFSKTNDYAHQHEYRMLWHTYLDPMPEHIDLIVPEAKQFCRELKNGG